MKYYSDILNLLFEKEEDLKLAEKKHLDAEKAKKEAQEKKIKEKNIKKIKVEQALEAAKIANENAQNLLDEYIKDYGSFTSIFKSNSDPTATKTKITNSDISEFINILTSFLNN